jgi:hypothetical protein
MVHLDPQSHDLETDADGRFELDGVLAGAYTLEVFNAFYGTRSLRGQIAQHGQVDDHRILYQLAGAIEGTVFAPDGVTPVADARVRLLHPAIANWEVRSDAEGRFRFEQVPPDERCCRIQVHAEEGPRYRDAEVAVALTQHGQAISADVVLPVQGTVGGRVEESDGTAVAGAVVYLNGADYPYQRLQAQTDADGRFSFTNILEGRIAVSAVDLRGLGGKTTAEIETEGQVEQALIRLEASGEIDGRVLSPVDGSAVPNAQVQLRRAAAQLCRSRLRRRHGAQRPQRTGSGRLAGPASQRGRHARSPRKRGRTGARSGQRSRSRSERTTG